MAIFLSQATKDSSPFMIVYDLSSGDRVGYRYLFDYWQVPGSNNSNDPTIKVVYSIEPSTDFKFGATELVFPTGWLEDNWL